MAELDPTLLSEIQMHCSAGDTLAMRGRYSAAMLEYNQAWELIPEPKDRWEAATWILAAIGDCSFTCGNYARAREALLQAVACPGGLANPFLHLRLGQVSFEKGELDSAADELMRAYMGDGAKVFANEDPKYLTFLKSRAKIPD
jgi:tetratricopeptide (TPR) repeat protein